jgi:paraquat-inducible protein A
MTQSLIACHICDLLHRVKPLPVRSTARCRRCGALLYIHAPQTVERTLAYAITGLVMIVIANIYPFLSIQSQGILLETNLITGVIILSRQSMAGLALLVLLTSMLIPCLLLGALTYVLWPLKRGIRLPGSRRLFRLALALRQWSMTEIFLLGILVSVVKLSKLATIIPGTALIAFLCLVFALAAVNTFLDPRSIWEKMERCR